MNIKFAGFLLFVKTYYLSRVNNRSEENFSHYNRLDQFIAGRHNCYSAFVVEKYGAPEARAGKASHTGWSSPGRDQSCPA